MKKLTQVPSVGAGIDAEMVRFPVAGWVVTFNTCTYTHTHFHCMHK